MWRSNLWLANEGKLEYVGTSQHVQQVEYLVSNFGINLEKEDKVILLLESLPHIFWSFYTTLMYEKETLKVEEVTITLLSHLKMKKNGDNSQAIGLVVICKAIVIQSQ